MRKVYIYIAGFVALAALLTTCYYLSYKAALHKFHYDVTEQSDNVIINQNNIEKNAAEDEKDAITAVGKTSKVTTSTEYVLETYDIKTDQTVTNTAPTPEYLIGLTREEVIAYLNGYIKNMSLEEYQQGLISYELVSFSSEKIVLRKTYNSDYMQYKYYIAVEDGEVVVYYSDRETIFEYTGIEAAALSEEEQIKLNYGIYVKDQEELYGILENYSS